MELEKKKPIVFTPHAICSSKFGRYEKINRNPIAWQAISDTWGRDLGLDILYRQTSFLETNIALNPDFATVEADQFLFNLTVDELQYLEKRSFFTEGQARFETPIQLLYTRRIGLGENEVIAGGKMHGRTGSYDFGVMDVITGDGFNPAYNFSAVRVKRDILKSSTIGLLTVSKNETSSGKKSVNQALGVDLNYQISGSSRLVGQLATSNRPETKSRGHAGKVSFQYNNPLLTPRDNLNWSTSLQAATDDFDIQDIGYFGLTSLDRRGIENNIGYSYWIKSRSINRVMFNQMAWYFQDYKGIRKVQDGVSAQFTIETNGLIRPGILLEKSYYLLPDTNKSYDNTQRTFSLGFGPYPRFMGEFSYRTGDNFGSAVMFIDSEIIIKPSDKMRLTGNISHLERDPFDTAKSTTTNNIIRIGFNCLFTPDMYWRLFVQSDSSDELALVNTLLRYEFRPGSVFYLSYKETRDDTLDDFMTTDRQLLAKVSYHLHR